MRTPDDLRRLEREFCSQGDTAGKRVEKLVFTAAEGVFVQTDDRRRLLDMQMFNSSANFGYRNAEHERALSEQLEQLPGIGSEYQSAQRIELSAEIAMSMLDRFGAKGRVHFSVSGAQAVEDALKVVAVATGRRSVFAFEGGYHGRTLAAAAVSSSYRYRNRFGADQRAHFVPFPYCYRCAYGKEFPGCNYYCVDQFERLFESEFAGFRAPNGDLEYSAFLAEPVLGRGGYVAPPPDYFHRLKDVLDKYGVLFIADDIQMGIYRTGKLWSCERFDVVPDILLFGKALTNGLFPVSGVWAKDPLMDPGSWSPSSAHSTFAGHPIGMAAGLATFTLVKSTDYATRAEALGHMLENGIRRVATARPALARIDRVGLALSLEFCIPGTRTPWSEFAQRLKEHCLAADEEAPDGSGKLGLLLTVGGYHDNVVTLSPSLHMTDAEGELFLAMFERYFDRVLAEPA